MDNRSGSPAGAKNLAVSIKTLAEAVTPECADIWPVYCNTDNQAADFFTNGYLSGADGVYEFPSHAIAREVEEDLACCSGRMLREWARECVNDGASTLDMRSTASVDHLLGEEDIHLRFVACLRERSAKWGAEGLTIETFHHEVLTVIILALLRDGLPGCP